MKTFAVNPESFHIQRTDKNCWYGSHYVVECLNILRIHQYLIYGMYLNDSLINFQINRRSTFCFLICSWNGMYTAVCFITNFDSQIKTVCLILIITSYSNAFLLRTRQLLLRKYQRQYVHHSPSGNHV